MLQWPERARVAIAGLYSPLQDFDIFVEDDGDEVFYLEFFRRVLPPEVRLERIISLGNRLNVIAKAKEHQPNGRKTLYLIDGDLEWVRGEPCPVAPNLVRLDAYCIENILLHESAFIQLIVEEMVVVEEKARLELRFNNWLEHVSEPLVELFIVFAAAHSVAPEIKTVATALTSVISRSPATKITSLDLEKVVQLRNAVQLAAESQCSPADFDTKVNEIWKRVAELEDPLRIVSGKDFLLPLIDFHMQSVARIRIRRKTLRVRLVRSLPLESFEAFAQMIKAAIEL